jgi:hypothetical protein
MPKNFSDPRVPRRFEMNRDMGDDGQRPAAFQVAIALIDGGDKYD